MKRGGQEGNQNARKAKDLKDALKYVLDNFENSAVMKGQALREVCKMLVEKALDGDMQAIKEIGDRIDGKPAQEIMGEDGGPLQASIKVSFVKPNHGQTD